MKETWLLFRMNQVQETCARLMSSVTEMLESPAFVPLSVGVICDQQSQVKVTHTAADIENALLKLLDEVIARASYCHRAYIILFL